jgi:hypothetical protein
MRKNLWFVYISGGIGIIFSIISIWSSTEIATLFEKFIFSVIFTACIFAGTYILAFLIKKFNKL